MQYDLAIVFLCQSEITTQTHQDQHKGKPYKIWSAAQSINYNFANLDYMLHITTYICNISNYNLCYDPLITIPNILSGVGFKSFISISGN